MGIAGGPNLNQDGLVFLYDVFDQDNSYKGEPTTNLANTDYLRTIQFHNQGGYNNAGSILDAPEKGLGWKKIIITDRGNNFRIAQFPYIVQNYGETRVYSVEYDFTSTSGYFIYGDGSSGFGGGADNGTRVYCTFTPPSVNNWHEALFIGNNTPASGINDVIYYRNYQVEVNTHPTQFTTGTRSATQGLLDVAGANQIDLTNVSFDSNAQIVFDGTNDYVNVGDTAVTDFGTGDFTVECIIKIDSSISVNNGYYKGIVVKKGAGGADAGFGIYFNTGYGKFLWSTANGSSGSEIFTTNTWNSLKGSYAHVVMVRQNGATNNGHFYINGIYESITSSATVLNVNNDYNLTIGASSTLYSAYYFQGEVPTVKIYNRALSAQEVLQNYNATKSRFGLK